MPIRLGLALVLGAVMNPIRTLEAQGAVPARWTAGIHWRTSNVESAGLSLSRRAFRHEGLAIYLDVAAAKSLTAPVRVACPHSSCTSSDQRAMARQYSFGLSAELHRPIDDGGSWYGLASADVTESHWQVGYGRAARAPRVAVGAGVSIAGLGGLNRFEVRTERTFDVVRTTSALRFGIARSW